MIKFKEKVLVRITKVGNTFKLKHIIIKTLPTEARFDKRLNLISIVCLQMFHVRRA